MSAVPRKMNLPAGWNGAAKAHAGKVQPQPKRPAAPAALQPHAPHMPRYSRMAASLQGLQGLGKISVLGQDIPEPIDLVQSISIQTTHGPDWSLNDPLHPDPNPSKVAPIIRALKPKITVRFAPIFGQQLKPVVIAPYGDPGKTDFDELEGFALAGAAAVGTLALLGLWSIMRGSGGKGLLRRYLDKRKASKVPAAP